MKRIKKILKWSGFLILFIALFAFTLIANNKRSNALMDKVNVQFEDQDLHFVQEEELLRLFAVEDSTGYEALSDIDLIAIEEKINENEYVENSHAFINNRGELTLKVRQREPLFRVFHQSSVNYYVDNKGKMFPISSTFTANVPIATGKIVYNVDSLGQQQGSEINNLITFFEFINKDNSLKALVSRVDVKPNGDLVFTPRMGKHIVNVGQPTDLEDKMNRLKIFYKEGLNKIGWDEYKEISLKYKDQIIAKKK